MSNNSKHQIYKAKNNSKIRVKKKNKGSASLFFQNSIYQIMPPLDDEEYEQLKADIEDRGVQVPIEVDQSGNILDGHHRVQICQELGITSFPTLIRSGMTEAEKRSHIRALNLLRRHLNQKQKRALVAEQLKDTPELSNRSIGSKLKVDDKTVGSVRRDLEKAAEIPQLEKRKGAEGKHYPAIKGIGSVVATDKREAKKVIAGFGKYSDIDLPRNKAVDARKFGQLLKAHTYRTVAVEEEEEKNGSIDGGKHLVEIRRGDFRKVLADIGPGSVDLILTDPPYGKDYLYLWDGLGKWARQVLRPGGVLVSYSGQMYLPDIYQTLSRYLEYIWTIAQVNGGRKTPVQGAKVYSGWKPILIYGKPLVEREKWIEDVIRGEGEEKGYHAWQQGESEAAHLVKTFSKKGELVIDPFMGSGTTAVAAVKEKRRYIGADIDEIAVKKSKERIRKVIEEL
jgi:16S rRNA G966 N2-methylase RsmD